MPDTIATGTSPAVSVTPAAETKPVIHAAPTPIHTRMVNTDADMLRDIAAKHQAGKAEIVTSNRRVNPTGTGYTVTITATVNE